jgi:hypothetical protein
MEDFMTLTNEEHIRMISELQNITEKVDLIDFLRKYYPGEYDYIFKKETEEKILIAKEKFSGDIFKLEDFDIRRYTYYLLENYIPSKLNISRNYSWLKLFKIIIFYENITNNDMYFQKMNNEIEKHRIVYQFIKALMSDSDINIENHKNAIKILGLNKLNQSDFDTDEYYILHDLFIHYIQDNYLYPFIEEYKTIFKKIGHCT